MDNIRTHIKNNFKDSNFEEIKSSIEQSITEEDEITLPGMGVFLEIIWNNCSKEMQNEIVDILTNEITTKNS